VRPRIIAVLDDDTDAVVGPLERWLVRNHRDGQFKFSEYDSTLSLVRALAEPSNRFDLLLVDGWLQEGRGGLEALDLASRLRPDLPAVLFTSLEDNGDRFMYALAAEAWFGDQNLKAIHPKSDTRDADRRRRAVIMLEAVIARRYTCPRLSAIRNHRPPIRFDEVFGGPDDVRNWRAVRENAALIDAARHAGMSENGLGGWENRVRDRLARWWEDPDLGQKTRIAGEPNYFRLNERNNGLHASMHAFAVGQVFFRDVYVMNQRFKAAGR